MTIKFRILILSFSTLVILLVYRATSAADYSLAAAMNLSNPARLQTDDLPPAEPLILTDGQGQYPLGWHLEILEDPGGELTIDEVSSPEFDSRFVTSQEAVPNFGFTDSVYWVRFHLDNQTSHTDEWLLEQGFANTHYIDFYSPAPDGGGFIEKQAGVLRPVSASGVFHQHPIFNLNIPTQSQETYYLRFQSGASMTLALTLSTKEAFLNYSMVVQILMGIFFGVMIGLLFYNLFLFFTLREKNYLLFVFLLASVIFEEASYGGYLRLFIIPDLNIPIQYIEPVAFPLMIAAMVLFSDSFLELKERLPKLHTFTLVILAGWGALMLLIPFTSYRMLATLMVPWGLTSLAAVLASGFAIWRSGYRPSRFFMLAWLGLILSLIWIFLVRFGFLSSTLLSENAFRIGYVWMAVCFSLALADRINLLKAETEAANRELEINKNRLSQILEGLPIGVVVYGKDRKPNYINQRTAEILNNPAKDIQVDLSAGRTLEKAIKYFSLQRAGSDEPYPVEDFPINRALAGEPASADDIEANLGDKRVPLEIWASPVKDDQGTVESAVVAFQDITPRKQAELAQNISETRFRAIAENIPDGIAFMGRDRKVLYVSPSYLRLVGKTAEELLGQTGIGLVHPDDREYTAMKFNEALQTPNTRVLAEYRIPHKDGSYLWVETSAINLLDNPFVQAVVLISHDITDRKQREAELADYRTHLERLVEKRTEELSNVNRQLKMRLDWLSAINLVNQALVDSTDLNQTFERIIEITNDLFAIQGSFIAKLDEGEHILTILAHCCPDLLEHDLPGTSTLLPERVMANSLLGEETVTYLTQDELNSLGGHIGKHLQDPKIRKIALVPLVLREKLFGFLGLEMRDEDRRITSDEHDLLRIFSTDIAQLIENMQLYEQSKALIASEERNRLARDLHDSVTQVLFSAALLADVLPQIWRRDPELGIQRLEKLQLLTRGALAEMRTMLLELRPYAVINTPLGDLLIQLTEAITSRSGVPFQLFIEQIPTLPEEVQIAFYRIAQEALNNIVKHAQARQITLILGAVSLPPDSTGEAGYEVKMVISDDGVGFSQGKGEPNHMGINIMRERAVVIQASLSLDSKLGVGSQVTLKWKSNAGSNT